MTAPSAIGRLRVVRRLGAGGFATVWLAHDPDLDAPVAVKLLADNWATDADVRRRFTDEARLLRRVDSDHLVRVYDVGELPDGRPYLVMTYADGGSLADVLTRRPPPWPAGEVLGTVAAIAAGLAVLHEHGVVHRDLKPRNVLLRTTPDGPPRVLLGDLGIAKDLQWASGITRPAGSDGYMAPEQRGFSADIGPATDVHALAVIAAQLLGLPGPPWPPTPLGAVVARATAPDPAARTTSAGAFVQSLRAALGSPAPSPVPVPPPPATPPPPPPMSRPVPPPLPPPLPPPVPAASGAVTAVAAPGEVTRRDAGPAPVPPAPVPPAPVPPAPGRRRRAVLAAAALVAVGVVGVAGRAYLTRDRTLAAGDGQVQVAVPRGWDGPAAVPFPGRSDGAAGARAGAGDRSVAVASVPENVAAASVLAAAAPSGCAAGSATQARVGTWTGFRVTYPSCPDGVTVDEVVLLRPAGGGNGDRPRTAWVEVRSVDGSPGVGAVLASLDIAAG